MMDVTFCLDARTVHTHFPGVGRYTANLARALVSCLDRSERLVVLRDPRQQATVVAAGERVRVCDVPLSPFALRQQWLLPRLLRRVNADLYHSPYYLMPFRPGVRSVLTVHDLIPFRYAHLFTPAQRLLFAVAIRLAVRAARVLVAVSATTASDLKHFLGLSGDRIVVVIPEAADPSCHRQPGPVVADLRRRLRLPERYVLYVGSNKPHKNLVRLVEAWARVRSAGTSLVIAGAWDARFPEAGRRAESLGLAQTIQFIGPVADTDLPALYSGALLFVFPSEYEGFGLPVIEAMACGTPVVCSNAASLPEVTGDAVLPFDPHDVDAIEQVLQSLLGDADRRVELGRRGLERAAQFSWKESARLTLAAYRTALG